MIDYETRLAQAKEIYQAGLRRVATEPVPKGQIFLPGDRVRIADDLGPHMSHFTASADATVMYTYAHAFGGDNVASYCLDIDGHGRVSWYKEHQLSLIKAVLPDE